MNTPIYDEVCEELEFIPLADFYWTMRSALRINIERLHVCQPPEGYFGLSWQCSCNQWWVVLARGKNKQDAKPVWYKCSRDPYALPENAILENKT